jgi:predicted pyridoxine 5'-phosphate oxidase superfamily flavin-nucleotide-binding protein
MKRASSAVAFTPAVKAIQTARGSRAAYARQEENGGFETEVTDELLAFLGVVDTAFLSSVNAEGQPYVQHRGGPKGFIRGIDERTIGFVDFAGNRQYVTTGNLTENDRVCIIAIDYERRRRVKIWGRARIVPATPELLARLSDASYRGRPEQVMLVTVTAWDVNCPQHIPQKLDARDVQHAIEALQARIQALEEENRRLRSA